MNSIPNTRCTPTDKDKQSLKLDLYTVPFRVILQLTLARLFFLHHFFFWYVSYSFRSILSLSHSILINNLQVFFMAVHSLHVYVYLLRAARAFLIWADIIFFYWYFFIRKFFTSGLHSELNGAI